jgi:hypothetical protein
MNCCRHCLTSQHNGNKLYQCGFSFITVNYELSERDSSLNNIAGSSTQFLPSNYLAAVEVHSLPLRTKSVKLGPTILNGHDDRQ